MYITLVEIPEGWRVIFMRFKNWKFRGEGGRDLSEIPSAVGVWIFTGTTQAKLAFIELA